MLTELSQIFSCVQCPQILSIPPSLHIATAKPCPIQWLLSDCINCYLSRPLGYQLEHIEHLLNQASDVYILFCYLVQARIMSTKGGYVFAEMECLSVIGAATSETHCHCWKLDSFIFF